MQLLIFLPGLPISTALFQSNNCCNKESGSDLGFHWTLRHVFFVKLWVKHTQLRSFWHKSWIPTAMKVPIQQCHCSWVYSSQLVPLFRNIKIHGSTCQAFLSSLHGIETCVEPAYIAYVNLCHVCGFVGDYIFVSVWELQEVIAHVCGFTVGHLPLVNLQKSGTRSPQIQKCRHSWRTQSALNEQTNSGRLFVAPGKVVSAFLLSACDSLSRTSMNQAVLAQYWGST